MYLPNFLSEGPCLLANLSFWKKKTQTNQTPLEGDLTPLQFVKKLKKTFRSPVNRSV